MRIVIDTNILIAALTKQSSNAARIIRKWRAGEFDIVSSEETLREAEAVVGASWVRRVANAHAIRSLLDELRERSSMVHAPRIDDLALKDAGDRRLVEAAVAGGARYLVTSDREVLRYRGHASTEFVTAGEFLRTLNAA
jgi:putative PIN family toxin of toxin-antitoxin system